MRLVRVRTPEGKAQQVAQIAFSCGLSEVTIRAEELQHADGKVEMCRIVDVSCATPVAKSFIDEVMRAPFFEPEHYPIAVRQPRTIVSHEPISKITYPLVEPASDLLEELWQFSHISFGSVGRILLAGLLLAYGLREEQMLLMIGGLLFVPLLPVLLALAFGSLSGAWNLVRRAALALLIGLLLLVVAGLLIGFVTGPPIRYHTFLGTLPSVLISTAVGIAGALGTVDDAGRRELLGLAAAAQIAVIPVWFGLAIATGVAHGEDVTQRLLNLSFNATAIVVMALFTYLAMRLRVAAHRISKKQERK